MSGGVVVAVGVVVSAVVVARDAPGAMVGRLARRRFRRGVVVGLPALLELLARSLRSGASTAQAVADAAREQRGPLADLLGAVSAEVERGVPLVVALDDVSARHPERGLGLFTAAVAVGAETGGAQARTFDALAATLRNEAAVEAETRALASGARASAVVIAAAPVAFAATMVMVDPRFVTVWSTPLGLACLAVGLALDAVGLWWMQRITAVSP